jgi:hypothetical protein
LFKDGKCVHIGTDGDHFSTFANLCYDTCLSNTPLHPISHLLQFIRNNACRAVQFESDFRMHVEVAPPFDEFF